MANVARLLQGSFWSRAKVGTASGGSSGGSSGGADPLFGTCGEANDHGYGNYHQGSDPEYGNYQDRDHDGVVCEF